MHAAQLVQERLDYLFVVAQCLSEFPVVGVRDLLLQLMMTSFQNARQQFLFFGGQMQFHKSSFARAARQSNSY